MAKISRLDPYPAVKKYLGALGAGAKDMGGAMFSAAKAAALVAGSAVPGHVGMAAGRAVRDLISPPKPTFADKLHKLRKKYSK